MSSARGTSLEDQVRHRIEALSYLPTTISVAMKFMELGKHPEAEPAEYARVVASDASLSAKLLALANSSWFGVRNKVTRPQIAVNLLGLGTVRTLALSYCLTGLHHELRLPAEESRKMWSAALCKAVAARKFAALLDESVAEEAFAAGMFQDFALPIMYACAPEQMNECLDDPTSAVLTRLQRERAIYHHDHAETGRLIAQRLELPELYVDAVAFHHQLASLRTFVARPALADALHVASLFPHRVGLWCPQDAEALRQFYNAHPAAGMMPLADYLSAVNAEFHTLRKYFEDDQAAECNLLDLLERATREIAENTERLVGTVHGLMNRQLLNTGR